jgi:hypothetical protein
MRKICAAIAVSAAGLILLASSANAHGHGGGARSLHFAHQFRFGHHFDGFRRWPPGVGWGLLGGGGWWWPDGGFTDVPTYYSPDSFVGNGPPATVFIRVPQGCHFTQETATVPSEAGGTREITIKRCSR